MKTDMSLSLKTMVLIIVFASLASTQKHHKVRHKHNLINLRDNHVNEIREAFDEYRNLLHKKDKLRDFPEMNSSDEYDDAIDNNLNHGDETSKKVFPKATEKPLKQLPRSTSEYFFRNKRVFTTKTPSTTQRPQKSIVDDDDEYFDNDNDTTYRRLNDDAQVRFNRDVSHFRERNES